MLPQSCTYGIFLLFFSDSPLHNSTHLISGEQVHQLNSLPFDDFGHALQELYKIYEDKQRSGGSPLVTATDLGQWIQPGQQQQALTFDLAVQLYQIIHVVGKNVIKPKQLYRQLIEAGLQDDKAQLFSTIWRENAESILSKGTLHEHSKSSNPPNLTSLDWRMFLIANQSDNHECNVPIVQLDLGLTNNDSSIPKDQTTETSSLSVNFTRTELMQFYDKLEEIQNKIDQLQS